MPCLTAASRLRAVPMLIVAFASPGAFTSLQAAAAVAKRPITHDVYDSWRSIQGTRLSRDGSWLVYALTLQEGDGELVARNLKTGQEWRSPRGKSPVLTADGRFVAFAVAPLQAETDKAKKAKKKPEEMPKAGLGLMDLATGKVETLERVKAFKFGEDGGRFLAALLEPEPKKASKPGEPAAKTDAEDQAPAAGGKEPKPKEAGTPLVLLELGTANRTTLPEVAEFTWSKDGEQLAYTVSVAEPKTKETPKEDSEAPAPPKAPNPEAAREGAFLRRMADGAVTELLKGAGTYTGLTFDEQGRQLAFLSSRDTAAAPAPAFKLYHWTAGAAAALELAAAGTPGLAPGWAPSEFGPVAFSKDGLRVFLGTAPLPKAPVKDAPEPVKVDIWSWKDPELQPMQKVHAEQERKLSHRAVVHLATKAFVQLGSAELADLEVNDNAEVALGFAPGPYRQLPSWERGYADVFALDLKTGARRLLARKLSWEPKGPEATRRTPYLSPGGKFLFYFDREAKAWMAQPTAGGPGLDLSAGAGVRFEEEDDDHPDLPEAYGVAGWTAKDEALVVYDRYDLWALRPAGAPRCLTAGAGRKDKLEFRYLKLDPEATVLPAAAPWVLSATQETTQASGFFSITPEGQGSPVKLVLDDQRVRNLIKAKASPTVVFTEERFDRFPDLQASDLTFKRIQKVTSANPQQSAFTWGRSELIDYVNADGKVLKAILTRPDNFDPAKKYPLMVYLYENMTKGLHQYQAPAPGTNINFSRYASNGYVILRPDIVYETGYPGRSAAKCVLPAVEKLLATGYIDPARVGIQGHSWGGYQITYLITQTNLFRCVEAGASVANMTSAYGGIRWGTGMSRAFQYEHAQSRIGGTPWSRPLQFLENSPLFWVERVQTPYLTIHNDEDDAVPWYQGIEFITALRRLSKEGWMFNYNGEKHGLRERPNQKHWTIHLDEYFDHYLLGAPRPAWMDTPVPWLDRGKRDTAPFYKKEASK